MSSGKKGSWEIPKYEAPAPSSFSNPLGTSYFKDNTYGFDFNPQASQDYENLTAMRNSILSGLGYTSPARESSLNQWQDTFNKEALRTSMPSLEQTLFSRGLGGSKFYQDAITDLLSKVATQGTLNREELAYRDEALKLSQLAQVNPIWGSYIDQVNNLTGKTAEQGNFQNQQAWNQYQTMLPYNAQWNQKTGTWDMVGGGVGAGAGFLLGGPAGAAMGYQLGSGIGNMFNQGGQSQLGTSLNSLASMYPTAMNLGNFANIAGMGQIPVAPANYYNSTSGRAF